MKETRGFTLLELLMVVIIIAILASIALPQYFRVTERSRTGQVVQLLASLRGSQIRFKAQSPATLYDTGAMVNLDLFPFPGSAGGPAMPAGWGAPTGGAAGAAGENVTSKRLAGANNGQTLEVDLDNGTVCASNAAAQADWGVGPPGC